VLEGMVKLSVINADLQLNKIKLISNFDM